MTDASAYDVYVTAAAVTGLTGVQATRIQKWVRLGLVQGVAVERAGEPGHLIYLYCLAEVQALIAGERDAYLASLRKRNH